jgi:hypothetical protein
MAQVGVGESREVCGECGAVIGDRERHTQWHELQSSSAAAPPQRLANEAGVGQPTAVLGWQRPPQSSIAPEWHRLRSAPTGVVHDTRWADSIKRRGLGPHWGHKRAVNRGQPRSLTVYRHGRSKARWLVHATNEPNSLSRQRPPPPRPWLRHMFYARWVGTTRHNDSFVGMACDARHRDGLPAGVPRWHARGQGVSWLGPLLAGAACTSGLSQGEAVVGCIVWSTTAISSAESASRSTSSRKRVLNTSTVLAASYLRRLKRRSTSAWMRRRAGWNRVATAKVAAATTRLDSLPRSWPSPKTTPA